MPKEQWRRVADKLLQLLQCSSLATGASVSLSSWELMRTPKPEPIVREQKRGNLVTQGKYLDGNSSWVGKFCGFSCKVVLKGVKK